MNEFSLLLLDFMNEHDMTSTEFAKSVGIAKSTVTAWIRGTAYPNYQSIRLLSRFMSSYQVEEDAERLCFHRICSMIARRKYLDE